MKFYPKYLGDFKKKTADLSLVEKGIYNELLDFCYANERALPLESKRIYAIAGAMTSTEQFAVDKVVGLFFKKNGAGYINERVEEELAKWQKKCSKAQASAKVRWKKE